jgi:TetR/AcrR family transcriptional regulator, lmrAB and yxaGH operons repressor
MTTTDSRQRMIESAAVVMRERGVEATSFSEVLARSGAPRGSIYHHFPGGKAQLIEEATQYAGEFSAAGLTIALRDDDPVAAVTAFCNGWIKLLRRSDFSAGCPVVAAALEGDRTPGAREAAAAAFVRWEKLLSDAIATHTDAPERAQALATLIIASVEGAVVLARATRSTAPLERVAGEMQKLLLDTVAR